MSKIAIIGAGDVGTTIAYTIQLRGLVTEVVLVDINQEIVRGQVMDLNHGLFFVRPIHMYAGNYADCTDADVIVLTAGTRQKPGESRLQLVNRNARLCKEIVDKIDPHTCKGILLVVTNPVDIMTRVVIEHSGLPKHRVMGSGTVLDSARFRYLLSRNCQVDTRNIHAYVIGEHGDSEVILWSQVHIGGTPLDTFCKQCAVACNAMVNKEKIAESVRKSAYHIIEAKGATNYGISLAVRRILEAIIRDEHSVLTVSTWLSGHYGFNDICLSVPCIINRTGVAQVIETPLAKNEEASLVNSAEQLRRAHQEMDSKLQRSMP